MDKKIYVFDLDDTICFPNHNETDSYKKYGLAEPNWKIISKVNQLKKDGHKIIISTARRMVTHNGDIQKILDDVGDITKDWLTKNNVSYDELQFGKPYGHYYIDDKAVKLDEI